MRYEVGRTYVFMRVLFTGPARYMSRYIPWEDTLDSIQTLNLTCKEHHKVRGEYSDEEKFDGFIFEDAEGGIWYNQFPYAAYGQLDDRMDYQVSRHFETKELFQVDDLGLPLKDSDDSYLKRDDPEAEEKWAIWQSTFESPLQLATKYIGELYRCVHPTARTGLLGISKDKIDQLKAHLDNVVARVEKTSGQSILFEPVVIRYIDPEQPPTVTSFVVARMANDPQVTKLEGKYVPPGAILSREEYEDKIKLKARFYRVAFTTFARGDHDPKLMEAERWFPVGISETGDDKEDELLYFHFRFAGRHFDSGSFLDYNVSRLNDHNNNFMFADKKAAEAYMAFIRNPDNASFFR